MKAPLLLLLLSLALLLLQKAVADKPAQPGVSGSYSAVSGSYSPNTAQEKSSSYSAPSPTYQSGSSSSSGTASSASSAAAASSYDALSQSNVYYYYYPVAAYPIHEKSSSSYSSSSSHSAGTAYSDDSDLSPLLFLIVPIALLLLAVPFLGLLGANINTGRSLDEKFGTFAELQNEIDLLLNKYVVALESEDCMERIICELGVKASAVPSKGLFFSVVEWLAPPEHALLGRGRLSILKKAATEHYTMEKCKRLYICHPPTIVKEGISKQTLINRKSV